MSVQIINSQIRQPGSVLGVIFDLDGVLLDTEKLYTRFWQEAAIALGFPMTHEQALGMRSLNREAGQSQLERYFGAGVSHADVRRKRIELMDRYIADHGVELKPGAELILKDLQQRGIRTALATSSPLERVQRYIGPFGLLPYFQSIVTGYDVERGKPAPDIYLEAAKRISLPPECCIAVEDSAAGIQAGFAAGCATVFIPDQDDLLHALSERIYAKADALLDLVELL